MLAEYDTANVLQKRYVFGPGIDEPLVEYTGSGTTSRKWLHADERGSIVAVSDDSGVVTQINKYDEFGKPQSTNTGRFQYTGQAWLPEIAGYHYKARAYAPHIGRFLQPDPIGYEGGPNLYAYVGNDPVNLVDPLGLQHMECNPVRVYSFTNPFFPQDSFSEYAQVCRWAGDIPGIPSTESGMGGRGLSGPGQGVAGASSPQPQNSSKPSCCNSRIYQQGQRLEALGTLTQIAGFGVIAIGGAEALFFGTMTGGPGAVVAIPTLAAGARLWAAGSAISTAGSAMRGRAGDASAWRNVTTFGTMEALRMMAGVGPAAGIVADVLTKPLESGDQCR